MKKITEKKRVTLTFTRLELDDGFIFGDAYDLLELLEQAEEVDGYFEHLLVYNSDEAKKLEELGVLSKSSRGSYSAGKNCREFHAKVYATLYPKE